MSMNLDKETMLALMVSAMVGPKKPAESEGGWEERVEDAIFRADRIWHRVLRISP